MTTWQRGRQIVTARRAEMEGSLQQFVDDLNADPARATVVRGTAIFLNRGAETTPLALRADVEHNHVRREHVAIAATDVDTIPRVPPADRVRIDALRPTDDGTTTCGSVSATPKTPDVPAALSNLNAEQTEGPLDLVEASS